MIRRLRWKFVAINMARVLAILVALCAVLMATTQDSLRRDSLTALDQAVTLTATSTPSYSIQIDPEEEGSYTLFGTDRVQLPYFTVQISGQNTLFVLANQFFDTTDQDTLLQVVNDALQSPGDTGDISRGGYHLRFLRVNTIFGHRIAFVDLTQERSTLTALARNLAFIGLGSLAVFFGISLLLAQWAVRPVEKSWKQQRQFVADASHELKTPLTVILSSLDMLEEYDDADPEKRQRWLDNVRASSGQMKTLVEEMLVLARNDNAAQPVNLERCSLSDLVEDDLLLFEPLAFERGKTIREEIAEHIEVTGDAALLRRVLDIYLDNACKYSPDGSVITVRLRGEGRRAVLSVHSQGQPIPHDQLERIFERFYRADPSRTQEGYGLGLAIATELAKLHHGKVWAQSDDTGNTFFFSLPRAKEERGSAGTGLPARSSGQEQPFSQY